MKVLHFYYGSAFNVRLQRWLQSDLDMGFIPALLVKEGAGEKMWIPDANKVSIETFGLSRKLAYLLSNSEDFLGLQRVFDGFGCDVVHAHGLECAYYSFKTGLPTVFDDWEYFYEFYDVEPKVNPKLRSLPFRFYRRRKAKTAVKELLENVPIIVTNCNVKEKYEMLGAENVFVVPNVPLRFERDYAFETKVSKRKTVTTGYVGNMSVDNQTRLRNTSGLTELWDQCNLGDLYVFEGENYCSHLEVLRKLRSFHFNLLFWKPLPVHKYYLQNKAFLASVVGVPTVVSSSLSATVDLLGEYALSVDCLDDIPRIMRDYDFARDLPLHQDHLWEFYAPAIKNAYGRFTS
jgi:hypothetical protein